MNFALITEGVSEYGIIKHITAKFFKGHDPVINQIQPKVVNDKQETPGGWNEVLKYCSRDEIKGIFVDNEYLIIQIDTDQSGNKSFAVSQTKTGGTQKTPEELHVDVVAKLKSHIQPDILKKYSDKIFFAICIHTIECWLLPLVYTNNHKSDVLTCFETLNRGLAKKNLRPIPPAAKNSNNGARAYEEILSDLKNRKDIEGVSKHNIGFERFVGELGSVGLVEVNG